MKFIGAPLRSTPKRAKSGAHWGPRRCAPACGSKELLFCDDLRHDFAAQPPQHAKRVPGTPARRSLCAAPPGLVIIMQPTQGLRPGLHNSAPTALFSVVRCFLDRLSFLVHGSKAESAIANCIEEASTGRSASTPPRETRGGDPGAGATRTDTAGGASTPASQNRACRGPRGCAPALLRNEVAA